jgi:hypothetical protein
MTNLSLPVSPYEQQWLAQSNPPPMQAPVDPFMLANNDSVSGMMPMQNQWGNSQEGATQQRVPPPPYPQYPPSSAMQGIPAQYPYQNGQVPPPTMPIPSGISTLPPQGGGYYQQHPNGAALSVPPNPDHYHNVPQPYRRVY